MTVKIESYDFKKGLSQEFELLNFSQIYAKSSEIIIKPHRLKFYGILWFQKGKPTHLVDYNPIKIKPDTLIFINKNSVQQFDQNSNFNGKAILFTDNFFCKTNEDIKFLRNNILFNDLLSISQINISDSKPVFTALFEQLENELKKHNDAYQYDIIRNLLKNLLLYSERERQKQDFVELKKDKNFDLALMFKDLLDQYYISHKNVRFYFLHMNLSAKRLNQATTKIFGKTPKKLIDERVLLASKQLLTHTNNSIKEITFSLGFQEPTNFTKYFKKHTGKTPVEFRADFTSA